MCAVLNSRDDDRPLSTVPLERLRELMPEANAYLISLYDKRTNRVSIPYSLEGEVVQVVEPFPLGQGVSSYIIQNAKPVFINREAERRVRELGALTVGEPAQSFIGVPVMAGELKARTVATAAPLYSIENIHRMLKAASVRPFSSMNFHWERGRWKRLRLTTNSPATMPSATIKSRQKAMTSTGSS